MFKECYIKEEEMDLMDKNVLKVKYKKLWEGNQWRWAKNEEKNNEPTI